MGMKNTGNYSFPVPDDSQRLEYSVPDVGTDGSTSMGNFNETKYSSNRRDNTSDYGGGNESRVSYNETPPFIIQLDGDTIFNSMQDKLRLQNARYSNGIPS